MKNVLVTLGANASLATFINALCNEGDEVVSFCPMFPMYIDHIEVSGAKLNAIPLEYADQKWSFNPDKLRAALSKPTSKLFVFNSPHNPTGKVFTKEEI